MHPLAVSPFMTGPGTFLPFTRDVANGTFCQNASFRARPTGIAQRHRQAKSRTVGFATIAVQNPPFESRQLRNNIRLHSVEKPNRVKKDYLADIEQLSSLYLKALFSNARQSIIC